MSFPHLRRPSGDSGTRRWTVLLLFTAVGLAGCGDGDAGPPPSTGPAGSAATTVGPTGTLADWLTGVVGCLRQEGWQARLTVDHTGIADESVPPSRQAAYQAASDRCEQAAGAPPNAVPMTAEHAASIYRRLLAVRTCLSDHGYTTSEPPAQQEFVQNYLAGTPPWSPYLDVPQDVQGQAWTDLNRACPQPE